MFEVGSITVKYGSWEKPNNTLVYPKTHSLSGQFVQPIAKPENQRRRRVLGLANPFWSPDYLLADRRSWYTPALTGTTLILSNDTGTHHRTFYERPWLMSHNF